MVRLVDAPGGALLLLLLHAAAALLQGQCSETLDLPLSLGPGFRLAARWNRLGETVKTRKKREKTGKKWARYSLRSVKEGS